MTRRLVIILAIAGMFALAVPSWAMVPDDVLTMRKTDVDDLSSDGRLLLYSVSAWDDDAGVWRTTHYRRDLDTEEELLIFTPEDRAHGPVWRPDGAAIAYLHKADDGDEIWLMDPDGGSRRRVSAGGSYGALRWSPDGHALAWIAPAVVGPYEGEPGARIVADEIGYRHLDDGYRQGKLGQLFVMDVGDGRPRGVLESDPNRELDVRELDWSPDGSFLVFAAKARDDLGRNLNTDLWVVDAAGGDPLRLTDNPGMDSAPRWHANDRIAYLRATEPLWESAPRTIAVLDPERGESGGLQHHAYDNFFWRWAQWRGSYYALGTRRGTIDLVKLDGGKQVFETEAGVDFWSLRMAGGRAVLTGAGPTLPGGIFLVDLAEKSMPPHKAKLIVDPNAEWRQRVGLVEPEPFSIVVDGVDIEGWFYKPQDLVEGERVPVVLSIHGGPEWMYGGYFLPEFHILPRYGYGVVIANPVGSTGYGFEFQAAIRGDWVGRPAREVLACVDHAVAEGWADPERLAVMGGSYGGHLTAALTTQTNRFRAAAMDRMHPDLAGFWGTTDEKWFPEWEFFGRPFDAEARDVYRRNSPMTHVEKVTTPSLISQGLQDYRCLIAGGETWFSALQSLGVPSRFIRFQEEGHGIRNPRNLAFYHDQLLAWFERWVLESGAEEGAVHD